MSLRIRQIVFAARELDAAVAEFERELGVCVVYRDPLVAEFGLHNALFAIGDQFLEVVSPIREDTAAGRHLARHGDSAYMLILQTDDLGRERARLDRLGVRVIWQVDLSDIRAVHLHPKDIGAAIVSLDQPSPPESWRWAGPDWQRRASQQGAREVCEATIGALDPSALARRWSEVLGIEPANGDRLQLERGALTFTEAKTDLISGYRIAMHAPRDAARSVTICGTHFELC